LISSQSFDHSGCSFVASKLLMIDSVVLASSNTAGVPGGVSGFSSRLLPWCYQALVLLHCETSSMLFAQYFCALSLAQLNWLAGPRPTVLSSPQAQAYGAGVGKASSFSWSYSTAQGSQSESRLALTAEGRALFSDPDLLSPFETLPLRTGQSADHILNPNRTNRRLFCAFVQLPGLTASKRLSRPILGPIGPLLPATADPFSRAAFAPFEFGVPLLWNKGLLQCRTMMRREVNVECNLQKPDPCRECRRGGAR